GAGRVAVDDDVPEPRLLDRVEVAPLALAVAPEHVELVRQLADLAAVVPDVGVPRDDAEQHALPAAADHDRRMRAARGLRRAPGVAELVMLAAERRPLLGPEELLERQRLVELREPDADGRELVAVALVLLVEPARAEAVDQAAAREHVDGRGHLRDQRR